MRSTTLLGGAAFLLAGTSLAADITSTATVTSTRVITSSLGGEPSSSASSSKSAGKQHGSAGTSTIQIYDLYDLHGTVTPDVSIITAGPTATVYRVACPLATLSGASSGCGDLTVPMTVTQGPSTLEAASVYRHHNTTKTIEVACMIGSSEARCIIEEEKGNKTIARETVTLKGTDMPTYIPAQVTGGAYRISNGTAPWGTGAASGSGVAKPTSAFVTSTGKTGPTPSTSPSTSPSPAPTGAASANAPALAGGALAGIALAIFAL